MNRRGIPLKILLISIVLIFFATLFFVSFIVEQEEKSSKHKPPGFWGRFGLVSLLATLILLPIVIGTGLYFLFVKGTSFYFHRLLTFADNSTILTTSLWIVVTLFICEYLFHPLLRGGLLVLLKKEYQHVVSLTQILFDSFFIYLILNLVPGVTTDGYVIAFVLSLGLFIIDSFVDMGTSILNKKYKKGIKNEGN